MGGILNFVVAIGLVAILRGQFVDAKPAESILNGKIDFCSFAQARINEREKVRRSVVVVYAITLFPRPWFITVTLEIAARTCNNRLCSTKSERISIRERELQRRRIRYFGFFRMEKVTRTVCQKAYSGQCEGERWF